LHAAREGAARLNLRLMAKVIRGQVEREGLYADEFLRFCPIIASLTREEVIFLAALHRLSINFTPTEQSQAPPHGTDENMERELVPKIFPDKNALEIAASAVLRTGFLVVHSGWGGLTFRPSPLLMRAVKLANFEAAVAADID
jgi:hypothetical protein